MNILRILTILIPLTLAISIYGQAKVDISQKSMVNLDLFRFIFSVLIIMFHGEFLIYISVDTHFIVSDVLVRLAVPFFFILTGYIVSSKSINNKTYETKYIKRLVKDYTFWFLIYIPILLLSLVEYKDLVLEVLGSLSIGSLSLIAIIPLGVFVAYFYMGSFYHLWYYPATFLSLGVLRFWNKKKWNIKTLLGISFLFFLFGLTETYYGILPGALKPAVASYFSIFYTTRNFLFFGLFYIVWGYVMGRMDLSKVKHSVYKLGFFFMLLVLESYFVQDIERFNLNFLFMTWPVTFYLFTSLLYLPGLLPIKLGPTLRKVSKYIYLIHPIIILVFVFMNFREPYPFVFGFLIVATSIGVSYWIAEKK